MKLSFMAFQRNCTIKEMMYESILATYNKFRELKMPVKEYTDFTKEFFADIIEGRCNL